jgi:O-succinylbenzoate synthase
MPQGLGTGALYTNNFDCPLEVTQGQLWYNPDLNWEMDFDSL